ncbi:MAG: hypothetical protein GXY77_05625 [Fibrobacter sp.]|nr:hypothetical protein [Fibrobacter sp.]
MKVMILIKADEKYETGTLPDTSLLAQMVKFNEELAKAGILLEGEGLHPSSKGKRIIFDNGKTTVLEGPFSGINQLIAGYWLWKVKSMNEAVEWVKRIPNPAGGYSEVEIRPIFEEKDFGETFTPELKEQEEKIRDRIHLKTNPYLNFNGNTEEAFNFYKSVFGGEFTDINRYKDMPSSMEQVPENEKEKIMHIALPIGSDTVLMGSDITENMNQSLTMGNNVYIMLQPENKDNAEKLYRRLSEGGKIEMPLEKVFWGSYFASFSDRFGVQWLINCEVK